MKPDPTTSCILISPNTMSSGKKVYISPVIDEASLEILACQVSYSPNMNLVYDMLAKLKQKLPETAQPILHSDQGFQYYDSGYQAKLRQMKIKQSMSRKGNCHDNAPGETIFKLMKREKLNRIKISLLAECGQCCAIMFTGLTTSEDQTN